MLAYYLLTAGLVLNPRVALHSAARPALSVTAQAGTVVPTASPTAPPAPAVYEPTMTPQATFNALAAKGLANSKMSPAKVFTASLMGGALVAVSGLFSMAVCGNMPGIAAAAPGIAKFTFGALFPVALFTCLQTGSQLFTGNTATMGAAYFEGKIGMSAVLKSWAISYVGNIIGSVAVAYAALYTGILSGGTAGIAAAATAAKCSMAAGPAIVKGIFCNWLVCLGVFFATQSKDVAGKYIGIFLPISAFVTIGFEHSVANMFILPAGLLAKAPVSLMDTIIKNFLPVTIGNAIAGFGVLGAGLSWQYGKLGEGK